MQNIQNVSPDILWLGANDRRLERFENIFPLPSGVSYNSYLILDEKCALMDTIDQCFTAQLMENLEAGLAGRELAYIVITHMEPDHAAALAEVCGRWPDAKIVGNAKIFTMLGQFFDFEFEGRKLEMNEGDTLSLGKHTLQFINAPMVHWPEVMMAYEQSEQILFSADAFGTFGALNGDLFADQTDFDNTYMDEARRYYANIVGKYGMQVQAVLKKAAGLPIKTICPLHGPVWRQDLGYFIGKYDLWSRYEPEKQGVVIAYGSMYGHTENAANVLASMLGNRGVEDIRVHDISKTHPSYIISDVFKYSHLVLAAPTYNMGLYLPMETLLHDLGALNVQNRKVAIIGNGTWAPQSPALMQKHLAAMKNMEQLGEPFVLKSALKKERIPELEKVADAIAASLQQ